MEKVELTIIGAGVVGLAIASSLAESGRNVVLLEKHDSFGQETSSRNSEVIHASIYYPQDYLKGKLCLQGNEMMYEICKSNNIPFMNNGKLIVATNKKEIDKLPQVLDTARKNGAKGVRIISEKEINKLEFNVVAKEAIYCPSSGVVDSHKLMQYFESNAINNGADILYGNEVVAIEKMNSAYKLAVHVVDGQKYDFETEILINAAGLNSGKISELAGIDIDKYHYRINYNKGIYFRVHSGLERFPKMLIYPVPFDDGHVGVHTCPDLYGGMRIGPHDYWVDSIDYSVDISFQKFIYDSVKSFLPFLKQDELKPDTAGIHPKIQRQGEGMQDFIIRNEADKGLPNFINLVGIESPGLTSSPAIAKYITNIIDNL